MNADDLNNNNLYNNANHGNGNGNGDGENKPVSYNRMDPNWASDGHEPYRSRTPSIAPEPDSDPEDPTHINPDDFAMFSDFWHDNPEVMDEAFREGWQQAMMATEDDLWNEMFDMMHDGELEHQDIEDHFIIEQIIQMTAPPKFGDEAIGNLSTSELPQASSGYGGQAHAQRSRVAAINRQIDSLRAALNHTLPDSDEFNEIDQQIASLQVELDSIRDSLAIPCPSKGAAKGGKGGGYTAGALARLQVGRGGYGAGGAGGKGKGKGTGGGYSG